MDFQSMTGDGFATWRKRLGLTQEGVAERFNISRSTVQNWERGSTPIPNYVDQLCSIWEYRLRQEDGDLGPVTLTYSDGPMWLDPYGPRRRMPMMQMEAFRTSSAALGRVLELWGRDDFHNPLIMLEDDDTVWNAVELRRMVANKDDPDDAAPIPTRWRAKVIAAMADYIGKVAIRYPLRSGPKVWSAGQTAEWEARVTEGVSALEALAAAAPAGEVAVIRKQVQDVLDQLREVGVFPSPESYHQFVAAFQ